MQAWNVLHGARWKIQAVKLHQNSPSAHHCMIAQICLAISSQLRHVSTIRKNFLNSNISSTCPHNMVNFGPLTAEIHWQVWDTPLNFNGFHVLASLFAWCLAVSGAGTLYTFLGGSCPLTEFCQVQNSLCIKVLDSPILAVLLHGTRAVCVSQTLRNGTRKGITELSLLVCSTCIRQSSHHVQHRPTSYFLIQGLCLLQPLFPLLFIVPTFQQMSGCASISL